MNSQKAYKKLIVWEKADRLVHSIYAVTKKFPSFEQFGVTSQLQRAALSVPTNIVEGAGRQSKKEMRRFVNIALGSLAETEYLIEFCEKEDYISKEEYTDLDKLRYEVGALLWNFHKSL